MFDLADERTIGRAEKRKMRIGLISLEYPPETAQGGIGSQTYLKAHGLASRGHDVRVISRSVDEQKHEYRDVGVRVTRIPGVEERFALHTEIVDWLTYSTEVAVTVAALHEREPFDLLDFPEWGGEAYVHLLNRNEWNHIPTVLQIHGPLVMFANAIGWPNVDSEFYRVGTQIEGTCLRLADAVFSSSACSADWCAEHYGLDRSQIPVLHTGIDSSLFRPGEIQKAARPTIIFVGRVTADKGVDLLVEAACQLLPDFPDLQVEILGRGDPVFIDRLKTRAAESEAPGLVKFLGFVDRNELPKHLSRAHVFAGPSTYEPGPGLVYLEAMACGLPVVACRGAGAAEVVIPEENGLLIAPQDASALAAALRRLLHNSDLRQSIGERARQYAIREADSEVCLRHIEQFYLAAANLRKAVAA